VGDRNGKLETAKVFQSTISVAADTMVHQCAVIEAAKSSKRSFVSIPDNPINSYYDHFIESRRIT
jgi:hypothetical protein